MKTIYSQSGIVTEDGRKCYLIPYEEIQWIKAEGNYCMLFTQASRLLVRQSLDYFQTHLKSSFFRYHRSCIVNLIYVELYDKKNRRLYLKTETVLPVARSLHKTLLGKIYDFNKQFDN
ncbi:MAG: LytTR family transcriptional regulator DNA-binding domain-containing protein [Prevotellaceae bacterium]|jgi:DNA-binding LytR/AlgR family response regulator|nr:LytTR family transcriptional regulator DNA-binding domain-containing protein [Prevotellaceae bacterium]